jgi:hypothetical protein
MIVEVLALTRCRDQMSKSTEIIPSTPLRRYAKPMPAPFAAQFVPSATVELVGATRSPAAAVIAWSFT